MSRISHKRSRSNGAVEFPFQVGDQCEHLWTVRNYQHTMHPVQIVKFHHDSNTVTARYIGFADEPPSENSNLAGFQPFRGAQPNLNYDVGDAIHFRMFGRRVYGKKVDGVVGDEEGVWVEGDVIKVDVKGGRYLVEHFDWDRQDEEDEPRTTRWVPRRQLRPAKAK